MFTQPYSFHYLSFGGGLYVDVCLTLRSGRQVGLEMPEHQPAHLVELVKRISQKELGKRCWTWDGTRQNMVWNGLRDTVCDDEIRSGLVWVVARAQKLAAWRRLRGGSLLQEAWVTKSEDSKLSVTHN